MDVLIGELAFAAQILAEKEKKGKTLGKHIIQAGGVEPDVLRVFVCEPDQCMMKGVYNSGGIVGEACCQLF
jgi:hypothetical protein